MNAELVVVGNASEAHLFSRASGHEPLTPVAMLRHEASRAHAGGAESGHGRGDWPPAGVAFEPRMDRKRKQHLLFANEISQRIDEELDSGRYGSLVIFASCPFVGELKGRLRPRARRLLRAAIDIDLTPYAVGELERRIDAALLAHAAPH